MQNVERDCYCKDINLDFPNFDCHLFDSLFDLINKEEHKQELATDRAVEDLAKTSDYEGLRYWKIKQRV